MDTRSIEKIYLIEYDESQIIGSKLPSNEQVLKVLFYNMRKVKLDLRSSAYLVIKEAEILWNKSRIPVRQIDRSVQKIEALYQEWKNLQKTCKRRTPLQKRREDEFINNMNNLFDIARRDALDIIKIAEDKEFLLNQRKEGRVGAMVGCDRSLFEKEKRTEMRIEKEFMKKEKQSKEQFQSFLTANDVKILPSITRTEKVDRLPVVITSNGIEHLLGIPVLSAGTGKEQADAIIKLLNNWNLTKKVQALCFDTTATNTGRLQGSCILLEQHFNRELLYLPCRHHMYELLLKSAFEKNNFQLSGPTLSIFQRFKSSWPKLNQQKFKSGIEDKRINGSLKIAEQEELARFAQNYLTKQHPRADYKELLELSLIFLGRNTDTIKFKSPGAFHHARWMAKAIYTRKIFLFRDQFSMSSDEANAMREICLFIVQIYLRPWIEAPIAAKAPLNDFIKNILQFNELNQIISNEVAKKFSKHLWYLTPEATALSFFDNGIPIGEKIKMVENLKVEQNYENKRIVININELKTKNISDFVEKKTMTFFERFSIPTDFLQLDPSKWQSNSGFLKGWNIVQNLHVVNDTAERFVKLMEEYNEALTKNEEEKQYILQIVTDYRKKYSSTNKSKLCD